MSAPIPVFHLEIINQDPDKRFNTEHYYYRSLSALYSDKGGEIGISLSTLQKYDFSKPFFNDTAIIRKGSVLTTKNLLE